jgi:hypothetical protein
VGCSGFLFERIIDMKLHNPFELEKMNDEPLLMLSVVAFIMLSFGLIMWYILITFGPMFLTVAVIVLCAARILYAVFKGK